MGRLLASVFGLRREERDLAFLMATYHFLLLVTLYLLKPVRDSLFLSTRGPAELPFVFILTTAAVVPVATIYTRAGRRLDIGPLIDGVSLFLVFSLVGLRGLLFIGGEWVSYALYAWVSIFGLLVTSQFWLLANALFTSSQSKRVFTVLSAGAIFGAIVGGEITGSLVNLLDISSENLLWIAGGVLLASTALGRWIRAIYRETTGTPAEERSGDAPPRTLGAFSTLRESRHLQLIIGIIALMVVVMTFVDFQFKTVAARAFPTEQGLTAFMGQFYGRVSVVALLLQFILAPWLMRVVGVGGALSMLPGVLALGSLGMLLMPGLAMGILLRGSGQSLKHSVDKTGRELLFVPVSLQTKKRVKVFVDMLIDQGAEGLGGVFLLVLVVGFGVDVQTLSLFTLVLIAAWGVLAYWARQSYVDQFRTKLHQSGKALQASARNQEEELDRDADLDDLLEALCSHVETDVQWALDVLEAGSTPVPTEALLNLLDHPADPVRAQVIRVFRVREVEGVGKEVAEALRDPQPDVQLEAARYLYAQEREDPLGRLRQGLQHEDPLIQAAAVGLIAEEGDPEIYPLVNEPLLRRLVALDGEQGKDTRTHVARILGVLDRPYRNELLSQLLHDDAPQVVRAAIRSAGLTNDRRFVDPLLEYLLDDAFEDRARDALASFGSPVLGTLYDYLIDERVDLRTRQRIPSIFAAQPSQLAAALLVRSHQSVPIPVRHAAVRALSRLHQVGDFSYEQAVLDTAIERETEHFAALGQILHLHLQVDDEDTVPISSSLLRSYRDEALERIFRLLGLRYSQRDIYDAYLGITSDEPALRESAVEFVDNLVDYSTRRYLLPLLNDPNGDQAGRVGAEFFDLHIEQWSDARRYLETVNDTRLQSLVDPSESSEATNPALAPPDSALPPQSVAE